MLAKTKFFGEIELEDDKVLEFPNGIIGFEDYTKFAILYDEDEKEESRISWLQSLEEPMVALPVIDPLTIVKEYAPVIEDELLAPLGSPDDTELLFLLALTVPSDMTKVTANMKAPFIINAAAKKGIQLIVENEDYPVKYNIYESVQKMKEKAGE